MQKSKTSQNLNVSEAVTLTWHTKAHLIQVRTGARGSDLGLAQNYFLTYCTDGDSLSSRTVHGVTVTASRPDNCTALRAGAPRQKRACFPKGLGKAPSAKPWQGALQLTRNQSKGQRALVAGQVQSQRQLRVGGRAPSQTSGPRAGPLHRHRDV